MQLASCCPSSLTVLKRTQRRSKLSLTSLQQIWNQEHELSYWDNKCKMTSTFKVCFQLDSLRTASRTGWYKVGGPITHTPSLQQLQGQNGICSFQCVHLQQETCQHFLINYNSHAVPHIPHKQLKLSTPTTWLGGSNTATKHLVKRELLTGALHTKRRRTQSNQKILPCSVIILPMTYSMC